MTETSATGPAIRRFLLLSAILVCSVGCDRATKHLAVRHLDRFKSFSLLGGFVRIQYAENPGAFLGVGGSLSQPARFWLLTVTNVAFLSVIAGVLLFYWNMPRVQFVALGLLLGGGVGNLIDRIARDGLVIDFLNVGVGPVRTGIFNVADLAITTGALVLFILYPRNNRPV